MTKEEILLSDDVIGRETPAYKQLLAAIREAGTTAAHIRQSCKPQLCAERYLTTEDVMDCFHISRRALQSYRDKGLIPHTSIGGVIQYPESKINEVLEGNYYRQMVTVK